ncbi:MBL fold metallo-hydrolase [Bacteroides graminisolvens]|uniref:MBL fold metallo-hydrolase n=1 Tax=Bacteroides graminisolvens TaxID=477666 RepID=UPI0029C6E59D|nr:MBL fold metallo-hydrolase [Bacteroides graminisolvens]
MTDCTITFYPAGCADAAKIRYKGTDKNMHTIFVDSGFKSTYDSFLSQEIADLEKLGEQIDLCVITHIHDDHIKGMETYVKHILTGRKKDLVGTWWYNIPRLSAKTFPAIKRATSVSSAKSIGSADLLSEYLIKNSRPVTDITTGMETVDFAGLTFTLLSPSPEGLASLKDKYMSADTLFERQECQKISEAKSAKQRDHSTRLKDFDLDKGEEDDSVENRSSIAFFTTFREKTVLWLADTHASTIVTSLREKGYSEENPLVCNLVKVSHHGSIGNNSNELFSLIRCDTYLFSVNGINKHSLPDKASMARILRNPIRPTDMHYIFYFTSDDDILRNIFEVDGEEVFGEFNFSVLYSETVLNLSFDPVKHNLYHR